MQGFLLRKNYQEFQDTSRRAGPSKHKAPMQVARCGAGLDPRKLLCDPCFEKVGLRFSDCDVDVNLGVITLAECVAYVSTVWKVFLNGIFPILMYARYLSITTGKQFCYPGDIWQYLETLFVVTSGDKEERMLLASSWRGWGGGSGGVGRWGWGGESGMPLSILQCTGQPSLVAENRLAPNANSIMVVSCAYITSWLTPTLTRGNQRPRGG